eukprot:contig_22306_g5510
MGLCSYVVGRAGSPSQACEAFSFFFPLSCALFASADYLVLCSSVSLCSTWISAAVPRPNMGHLYECHITCTYRV